MQFYAKTEPLIIKVLLLLSTTYVGISQLSQQTVALSENTHFHELTRVVLLLQLRLRITVAAAPDRMLGERQDLQLDALAQRQVLHAQAVHVSRDDGAVQFAVLHHLVALQPANQACVRHAQSATNTQTKIAKTLHAYEMWRFACAS